MTHYAPTVTDEPPRSTPTDVALEELLRRMSGAMTFVRALVASAGTATVG